MDLEAAIGKHAEWKLAFRQAIHAQQTMDAAAIAKDDSCDLGRWLYGEGKAAFGHLHGHAVCVHKHAAFHVEAGKVAAAINASRYADADAMLESGTPYAIASSEVAIAVMKLLKESRL